MGWSNQDIQTRKAEHSCRLLVECNWMVSQAGDFFALLPVIGIKGDIAGQKERLLVSPVLRRKSLGLHCLQSICKGVLVRV